MIVYFIITFEFVLLVAYEIYRISRKGKFDAKNKFQQFQYRDSTLNIITEDDKNPDEKPNLIGIRMSGYKNDTFGSIVRYSVILMSIFWMFIFLILIMDYYGWFSGINYRDQAMLLVDQRTLSIVFIVIWNFTAIWFITLYSQSTNLLTYFLGEESLENSSYVLIEKKMEVQNIVNQKADWVSYLLRIEKYFHFAKLDSSFTLVPVDKGKNQGKFIEFECVRYNYNPETRTFSPHEFSAGSKNVDLHHKASGLTSVDAFTRADLVGLNRIAFKKPTFWTGIKEE